MEIAFYSVLFFHFFKKNKIILIKNTGVSNGEKKERERAYSHSSTDLNQHQFKIQHISF